MRVPEGQPFFELLKSEKRIAYAIVQNRQSDRHFILAYPKHLVPVAQILPGPSSLFFLTYNLFLYKKNLKYPPPSPFIWVLILAKHDVR